MDRIRAIQPLSELKVAGFVSQPRVQRDLPGIVRLQSCEDQLKVKLSAIIETLGYPSTDRCAKTCKDFRIGTYSVNFF